LKFGILEKMQQLLKEIKQCKVCESHLSLGANPVLIAHPESKILIIGQAPGTKVHATGIPFNDPSGERLRDWLGVNAAQFYDKKLFAIMPMGFCYPGRGKSGDLPPRKKCAPLWHPSLLDKMPNLQLTLLIGSYAQKYYLPKNPYKTLTETVRSYKAFLPKFFPLPHPSPRNNIWLKKHAWFEEEALPSLKKLIAQLC